MGNTLKSSVCWTKADVTSNDIKIEFTSINKYVLSKICHFILNYPTNFPREAKYCFKTEMKWKTSINVNKLNEGFEIKDNIISSTVCNEFGIPIVRVNTQKKEITVINILGLSIVLSIADTSMLNEVKTCLEKYNDPILSMFGCSFFGKGSSGVTDSIMGFIEHTFNRHGLDKEEVNSEIHTNKLILRMVLQFKEFDDNLKSEVMNLIAKETKLTGNDVNSAVNLLMQFLQKNEYTTILKSISWMSPYTFVFDNGCRAPLWRQLYGDISYIQLKTSEDITLYITANTEGYFVSKRKSLIHNDDGDFERESPFYKSLFALLRDYSPMFAMQAYEQLLIDEFTSTIPVKEKFRESINVNEVEEEVDMVGDIGPIDAVFAVRDSISKDDNAEGLKDAPLKSQTKLSPKIKKINKPLTCLKFKRKKIENKELTQWLHESSTEEEETAESEGMNNKENEGDAFEGDGPAEATKYHFLLKPTDMPSYEHWNILKLLRYIKNGNLNATIVALCSVLDLNLSQESCALSLREGGGCELFVNLLELDNVDCKTATLKIIKSISYCRPVRQNIINIGGIEIMVNLLYDTNLLVRCLAAECLGLVAQTGKARKTIRKINGIVKLVGFLESDISWYDFIMNNGYKYYPTLPKAQIAKLKSGPMYQFLKKQWQESLVLALYGSISLSHFANSKRNRKMMQMNGVLPFLAGLLKSNDVKLLSHVALIVSEFAKEERYRSSLVSEGMISNLVRILDIKDISLLSPVCTAFFKASSDELIRKVIRNSGGIDKITAILKDERFATPDLLIQLTGAISKLCLSPGNVVVFVKAGIIPALIPFLKSPSDRTIVHTAAAFSEILKFPDNRLEFHRNGGLTMLLALQIRTNPKLLVHVNYALAQCAEEKELIGTIVEKDGIRLLWSQLRNNNDDVKASAAWALCPCVKNAPDSAHLVRSYVCGAEVLINLLKSKNSEVLAATCAAIGSVAEDEENLGVLTQYGVVLLLSKLICSNVEKLQCTLAEAIAMCCSFGDNRTTFGNEDVVGHLVDYLKSNNLETNRSTARALYELSLNPDNCIRMHAMGCVEPLVKLIGSHDNVLQEAASKCVANIRRLALANQIARDGAQEDPNFAPCVGVDLI